VAKKCAVERAADSMSLIDREALRILILDNQLTAGDVSAILHENGYPGIDRMAIGHFRRKLAIGKATVEFG
jgi:hypothetical protein